MARRARVPRRKELGSQHRHRNKNPKLSPFQREQKRTRLANQPPVSTQKRDFPASARHLQKFLTQKKERDDARRMKKEAQLSEVLIEDTAPLPADEDAAAEEEEEEEEEEEGAEEDLEEMDEEDEILSDEDLDAEEVGEEFEDEEEGEEDDEEIEDSAPAKAQPVRAAPKKKIPKGEAGGQKVSLNVAIGQGVQSLESRTVKVLQKKEEQKAKKREKRREVRKQLVLDKAAEFDELSKRRRDNLDPKERELMKLQRAQERRDYADADDNVDASSDAPAGVSMADAQVAARNASLAAKMRGDDDDEKPRKKARKERAEDPVAAQERKNQKPEVQESYDFVQFGERNDAPPVLDVKPTPSVALYPKQHAGKQKQQQMDTLRLRSKLGVATAEESTKLLGPTAVKERKSLPAAAVGTAAAPALNAPAVRGARLESAEDFAALRQKVMASYAKSRTNSFFRGRHLFSPKE